MALGGFFQREFQSLNKEEMLELKWVARPPTGITREWALTLLRSYFEYNEKIEALYKNIQTKWSTELIYPIIRSIVRLGLVELFIGMEKAIVIDEAVRLAKKYCGDDSYKFVNAVLDEVPASHDFLKV